MLSSQLPPKFQIPFANNAGPGFLTPIPLASQIGVAGGRASLTDGFPPLTFTPLSAGGVAPWGADMNGLLNQMTQWERWVAAGGGVTFDGTFSAAVGGYPVGATLQSVTAGGVWVNLKDSNTVNPDTTPGAPGWMAVAFITPVQNSSYVSANDTGVADAYVAQPLPLVQTLQIYQRFQVRIVNANLTTTPTLNIQGLSGFLGPKTIIHPNGTALLKGELAAGMIATFIFDGASFQLQNSGGGGGGGGITNIQTITASGNYTPTPGAQKALVFSTGGGGAGGCALSCGGGGGAGATCASLFSIAAIVNISGVVPCTIGAGGIGTQAPPAGSSVGGSGGSTVFGTFLTAAGGQGGPGSDKPGNGGVPATGTLRLFGGDGQTALFGGDFGSGNGGASYWGGGGQGASFAEHLNGYPGNAYGSGGGGCDSSFSGRFGGNGAGGVIFVMEF